MTISNPKGDLALRTMAMPGDANPNGDIFGGWVMAQMDLAGSIIAGQAAKGRIATVGIEAMSFHLPIYIGDVVSCYAYIEKIGQTSIRVHVSTWVNRRRDGSHVHVTEGIFTFVAIDDRGQKRPVPRD